MSHPCLVLVNSSLLLPLRSQSTLYSAFLFFVWRQLDSRQQQQHSALTGKDQSELFFNISNQLKREISHILHHVIVCCNFTFTWTTSQLQFISLPVKAIRPICMRDGAFTALAPTYGTISSNDPPSPTSTGIQAGPQDSSI